MSSLAPPAFPSSQTTRSKRYPYTRPRRATARPAAKQALVGEPGSRFPLQAKKRGHNFSLGSQQISRTVSTSKPRQKNGDATPQEDVASTTTIDPALREPRMQTTAYVPIKLPGVRIPPVDPRAFCYGRLAEVPSDYVLSQLQAMSPNMLKSATLYRPTPPSSTINEETSPNRDSSMTGNLNPGGVMDILPSDTIRFDIPSDAASNNPSLYMLGGLEPTHCLAVRPRVRSDREASGNDAAFGSGFQSKSEEVGRMIPIHHMIYASQCANFPRPIDYAPSDPQATFASPVAITTSMLPPLSPPVFSPSALAPLSPMSALSAVDEMTLQQERGVYTPQQSAANDASASLQDSASLKDSPVNARSPLPVIMEEAPSCETSPQIRAPSSSARQSSTFSSWHEYSPASSAAAGANDFAAHARARPLATIVDLPMVHVTVPYPSSMPLVHGWLYNPSPPILLASLLDLPRCQDGCQDETSRQPAALPPISQRLASLPVHAILDRMQKIHKLWSNVVALRISDAALWKVMDRAWDTLVAALKTQGGEAVHQVPSGRIRRGDEGLDVHSEVVRKFSMATIRDPRSRAGSVASVSSR